MSKLVRMETNYYGPTLYIETRTGREYACRAWSWAKCRGGAIVQVQTWPGYGTYRGTVKITREQLAQWVALQNLQV